MKDWSQRAAVAPEQLYVLPFADAFVAVAESVAAAERPLDYEAVRQTRGERHEKRLAFAFLNVIVVVAQSQLLTAAAQQNNKEGVMTLSLLRRC